MIPWPWLIAAFALGGIASLVGLFVYATGGLKDNYIYAYKAVIEYALAHKDEIEERAKQIAWDECRKTIKF